MSSEPNSIGWARELQAIAQTGLHFTESEYDRERYQEILAISIKIFAHDSGESPALIRGLSLSRVTREQIQYCFGVQSKSDAHCRFD
jgi:hypothetical protein